MKAKQELARHFTPGYDHEVYGQARDEKMRQAVESVGNMLFADNIPQETANDGSGNNRAFEEQ